MVHLGLDGAETEWQRVKIDPDEAPGRWARLAGRFPRITRPVDGPLVGLVLAVMGAAVAVVAYGDLGRLGRFGFLVLGVMAAVSGLLIWLAGV